MKNKLQLIAFILCSTIICCNKKFDEPPTTGDPDISSTLTIRELKAMHNMGNIDAITDDDVIEGIVIADDKTGNFYKQLIIQDETGGIAVRMDGINMYVDYPVGRKIFVKLKGLYIGDYNRSIQLGAGIDKSNPSSLNVTAIASNLFSKYVVKGSTGNKIIPVIVSTDELNESYQNTLIQLDNFQFAAADTSKTYGDVTLSASTRNFNIKNCAGNSITLRNSSYAKFADINVPNGSGTITGIFSIFGTTRQFYIRDTSDVQFTKDRCNTVAAKPINIADLRGLFKGTTIAIPDGLKIKGIVISDRNNGNINSKNTVIQQGNNLSGIMLRCIEDQGYNLGDELEINISNLSLQEFSGVLQINDVPSENIVKTGAGNISARAATIASLLINFEAWESTLITLQNVKLNGGTNVTWNGTINITDATGNIKSNTLSSANFAGSTYPGGSIESISGIVIQVNTDRLLNIRNTNDVSISNNNSDAPDLLFSEYIEGSASNKYLELYNAGSTSADLSKYSIKLYKNGSASASVTLKLNTLNGGPAMLGPGALLVLKNTSAKSILPATLNAYPASVCAFNGDDAISLEKDGKVIDIFGEPGADPGTSWTIAGDNKACVDKTLKRKKSTIKGNPLWSNAAAEWDVISIKDDVSDLGKW